MEFLMFGGGIFGFIVIYLACNANAPPLQRVFQITTFFSIGLTILSYILGFPPVVVILAILAGILSTFSEIKYIQDDVWRHGVREEEASEIIAYQYTLIYRIFWMISRLIRNIFRF